MDGRATASIAAIAAAFAQQAQFCDEYGAPFYAELCRRIAADVQGGGRVADLVRGFPLDSAAASLPLRVLAGAHALVLAGRVPALAGHYASAGGAPRWPDAWQQFVAVVGAQADALRPWLDAPPQTNEVGRSAALLGGFLTAAAAGLPLRLFELGASAGLNLRWDRYRCATAAWSWGAPDAAVVLRPRWRGPPPPLAAVRVAERAGCDLSPLDPRDPAMRARLRAWMWPDRSDRLRTLNAALDVAAQDELAVERADAAPWLEAALAAPSGGVATVVFHSSVWGYFPVVTKTRIEAALDDAGDRATADAPLHWLRWEDEPPAPGRVPSRHELRLRSWPGAEERLLAVGQPHGDWIEWLA